jgi:hypothetical protein
MRFATFDSNNIQQKQCVYIYPSSVSVVHSASTVHKANVNLVCVMKEYLLLETKYPQLIM